MGKSKIEFSGKFKEIFQKNSIKFIELLQKKIWRKLKINVRKFKFFKENHLKFKEILMKIQWKFNENSIFRENLMKIQILKKIQWKFKFRRKFNENSKKFLKKIQISNKNFQEKLIQI